MSHLGLEWASVLLVELHELTRPPITVPIVATGHRGTYHQGDVFANYARASPKMQCIYCIFTDFAFRFLVDHFPYLIQED